MFVPLYLFKIFKRTLILGALAAGLFGVSTAYAFAADISFSPSTGSYATNQTFTVTAQVDPKGQSVNAVEANLTFDTTKLAVVSVAKTGSVFSLWTTEPTFSNTDGTITFGGGSPTPFSNVSTLVTITFRAVAEGTAKVGVSSASVLAADGKGTDVYGSATDASYTVTASAPTPPPPTTPDTTPTPTDTTTTDASSSDAAITYGEPPRAPEISSTVFIDPETWYSTKDGSFTWDLPFDVTSLKLNISTSSEFEPTTTYNPPISELKLDATKLIDGVQYLSMQYKNQVGWGAVLHRKIMIDTVPPPPFAINVRAGNSKNAFPLLTWDASDTDSGIDKYQLKIADQDPVDVTPDEAKLGYLLGSLEDGTYTVSVTAYDKAGNKAESTTAVLITAGWHPPVQTKNTLSFWDAFKGKNLIMMILGLIIIGQFVFIYITRKRHNAKEEKLRKETREIQDQMERIFSALRDEIYDQINAITKRPRLSKHEKEAVEGLSQALEVSETLIEKEISDVSKILK